ncbi:MAG: recombinase family protein [Candidatus Binatia bacterium]
MARILRWRTEGLSYHSIAARRNQRHVPTRREGAKWSASTVYRIIRRLGTESIEAETDGSDSA